MLYMRNILHNKFYEWGGKGNFKVEFRKALLSTMEKKYGVGMANYMVYAFRIFVKINTVMVECELYRTGIDYSKWTAHNTALHCISGPSVHPSSTSQPLPPPQTACEGWNPLKEGGGGGQHQCSGVVVGGGGGGGGGG